VSTGARPTFADQGSPAGAEIHSATTSQVKVGDVPDAVSGGAVSGDAVSDDAVVDAVLLASRSMVSLAEASLRQVSDDVTLAQYRTLVLLMTGGPCRLGDLARATGVNPSTATRMCDRLIHKGLVTRARDRVDRRETVLSLTDKGQQLVDAVTVSRRSIIRSMLQAIPLVERRGLVRALTVLAEAMRSPSDPTGATPAAFRPYWASGWTGTGLTPG